MYWFYILSFVAATNLSKIDKSKYNMYSCTLHTLVSSKDYVRVDNRVTAVSHCGSSRPLVMGSLFLKYV